MANIQFIKGLNEKTVPEVRITRSRDGKTGTATFIFINPELFRNDQFNNKEITGMYLQDDEGEILTRNVNAKFINGKPKIIQALYIVKNVEEWNRFMRFMEKYSDNNGLSFIKE